MIRIPVRIMLALALFAGAAAYTAGILPSPAALIGKLTSSTGRPARILPPTPQPVTVVRATAADFAETVLLTGSLVARQQIMVSSQIAGLRIVRLAADEGDHVVKGQILAELVPDQLQAQLAQNSAALAKAEAGIKRAKSQIDEAKASLAEAQNAFRRGKTLRQKGHIANSAFDTRQAALRTSRARLAAARDGLSLAKADKTLVEAQRRELDWKLGNTRITAPRSGIISHKSARLGATTLLTGEPLFRIIDKGEIEFEAEVPENDLPKLKVGQKAKVTVAGLGALNGKVRLIYPEIDKLSRLGKVRIFLGANPSLHVGAFARGEVETRHSHGIAVPLSALSFGIDGAQLQVVIGAHVITRKVRTGLSSGGLVEITSGLAKNDLVVRRAGTFLRNGDRVTPIESAKAKLSEAF